jgi:hypothetical protein
VENRTMAPEKGTPRSKKVTELENNSQDSGSGLRIGQPGQFTEFITGQNEREETTQNTIVTKSAACARL